MTVPVHVDIVDRNTGTVVATHALYPNDRGSLCLTGSIDLPAGTYDFGVRIWADGGASGVMWDGGAIQAILGQTVTEAHCIAESTGGGSA